MDEHHHHDGGHGHGDHEHHLHFESPETAAHAEAEAEVLLGVVEQAATALAERAVRDGLAVQRVLDLGSGPGVGTCELARRFPEATVVAADGSDAMLARAAARADRLGVGGRVETRSARFPDDLAALGPADVVWASMVLHHIGDEAGALRTIRELLVPGGLVGVVEHDRPLRLVPAEPGMGDTEIWDRLDAAQAAWFTDMRAGLPGAKVSADPRAMAEAAGFEVVADDVWTVDVAPPLDPTAIRFAAEHVRRALRMLERYATAADLDVLGSLIGDDGRGGDGVGWDHVTVRATRRLLIGRA